jgi:hypothetical protein
MVEQAGEFGVRMNALPHYVVSTTPTEEKATWQNTTIIRRVSPLYRGSSRRVVAAAVAVTMELAPPTPYLVR